MTTEAKVGAFVLGCFAVLAFTVIYQAAIPVCQISTVG